MNVELINNERKGKKPESWLAQARRVRLMRGLGKPSQLFWAIWKLLTGVPNGKHINLRRFNFMN